MVQVPDKNVYNMTLKAFSLELSGKVNVKILDFSFSSLPE